MLTRRLTWSSYALMVAQGFLIYSVSYITPYMESELGAPTWAAAIPSASLAVGFLVAGWTVPFVVRRFGPGVAVRLWASMGVVSALLLGLADAFPPVLLGAFLVGLMGAGTIVHVVSAFAGVSNGMYLVRASMWSVVGGLTGPLVLSLTARSADWNTGLLVMIPVSVVVSLVAAPSPAHVEGRASSAGTAPVSPASTAGTSASTAGTSASTAGTSSAATSPTGRSTSAPVTPGSTAPTRVVALGRNYRLVWVFLLLSIGAEFAFVAWGAQVAVARNDLALADGTAIASLFVVGELIGRIAWGVPRLARTDRRLALRASVGVAAVGALLLWLAPSPFIAGLGLLLGGLGIAIQYPIASSLALAHAPGAAVRASSVINLASALSISGAPLLLGFVAAAVGVLTAWSLTLVLLAVALAVILAVPAPASPAHD